MCTYIPRHAFLGWLIVQERLLTKDRLMAFGVINDELCEFCQVQKETHSHLLYECSFSRQCWGLIREWLGVPIPSYGVVTWYVRWRCASLMKKQIVGAAIVALWYHIWRARNICRLEAKVLAPKLLLMLIKKEMKLRCRERKWTMKIQKLPWEPLYD